VLGPLRQSPPSKWVAALWSGILAVLPLTLGIVMLAGGVFGRGVVKLAATLCTAAAWPMVRYACQRSFRTRPALRLLSLPAAAADHMQTRLVLACLLRPLWWPSPCASTPSASSLLSTRRSTAI